MSKGLLQGWKVGIASPGGIPEGLVVAMTDIKKVETCGTKRGQRRVVPTSQPTYGNSPSRGHPARPHVGPATQGDDRVHCARGDHLTQGLDLEEE